MATTMTSREFNQNACRAKRAAADGPVFVTDRGRPSVVVLSIEEYERLAGKPMSVAESLAQADPDAEFDWDPEEVRSRERFRPADLALG